MSSEFRSAPNKRYAPTVVFIHQFGGSHATTLRHQNMMLKLGFDCYAFDLSLNEPPDQHTLTITIDHLIESARESVIHVWKREIKAALDEIAGPKILYSFSFPSVTVTALLATESRSDVLAWITDGGPFLDEWRCMWNLYTWGFPVANPGVRALRTAYGFFWLGGIHYARNVRNWLRAIDPQFPILSVRGGRDKLVPPKSIAKFFACNANLNLTVFDLPEGGHLDGLKQFPALYRAQVENFLSSQLRLQPAGG